MKLIICKDIGSASIISENERDKDCIFFLKNPAKKFFKEKGILSENLNKLEKAVIECECIITGTSWPIDIEYKAIKLAKKYNKKIITYLDHWVNYLERFNKNKKMFPDVIITTDKKAFKLAKKNFPLTKILLKKNMYIENLKKEYNKLKKEKKFILYLDNHLIDVKNNIINKKKIFGHNEKSIFENFVKNINKHKLKSKKILIRIHPKKGKKNILNITKNHSTLCKVSTNKNLIHDIAKSEIVVGWNSMAMYIAHKLGKKVMHILPKGFKDNILPIKDIIYLEKNEKN